MFPILYTDASGEHVALRLTEFDSNNSCSVFVFDYGKVFNGVSTHSLKYYNLVNNTEPTELVDPPPF